MLIGRLLAVLVIFWFSPVQGMDSKRKQPEDKLSSDSYKQRLRNAQEDLKKLSQENQTALESQEDMVTLIKEQIRKQCSHLSILKPFPQELNKLLTLLKPPEQLFSPEEHEKLTELVCAHNLQPIHEIRQHLQLFIRKWKMLAEYSRYDFSAYYTFWYEKRWTELVEKITSRFPATHQKAIGQQLLKEIYDAYYFFHKQSTTLLNAYENLAKNNVSLPEPLLPLKATFDKIRNFFDQRGSALWQVIIWYIKSLDLCERYTFSSLGIDPPFTDINNLGLGVLGLYVSTADNKLYCKLKNVNPPIEITSQGGKAIKGILVPVFARIKKAVEEGTELENEDKKTILNFISQFNYEAPRVGSNHKAVYYPYILPQNLAPFENYKKLPGEFYIGENPIELIIVSLNKKTKVYFDYQTKMSLLGQLTQAFTYPEYWQEEMTDFIKATRQVFPAQFIIEHLEKLDRYYEKFLKTCKYNTSAVPSMISPQVTIIMPGYYQGRTNQQAARGVCDLFSNGDICFDVPNLKIDGDIAERLMGNIIFTKGRSIPLNIGEQLAWFLAEQLFNNLPSDPTVFMIFDNIHFLQPPPSIAEKFRNSGTLKPIKYWDSYFENPDGWINGSKVCFSIAHRQIEGELLDDFLTRVASGQAYLHQINRRSLSMQILFSLWTQSSISPTNFVLVKDKEGSQFSLKRVYHDIQANDSFHSPSFGHIPVHKLLLKSALPSDTEPEMGKIYIGKKINDILWYTVKRPNGSVITKSLSITLYEELTNDTLRKLESQILEEALQNGDILPDHNLIGRNFLCASPWVLEKIPQEVKDEFASNDILPLLLHWLHKLSKFQTGYFAPLIQKYNLNTQDSSLHGGSQAQSWGLNILTHPKLIEQLLKRFPLICNLLKSDRDITYFQLFEKLYPHEAQCYSALIMEEQQKTQSRETQLFFNMAPSLIKRLRFLNSGMADLGEIPSYTDEELSLFDKLASACLEEAQKNKHVSFSNLLESVTTNTRATAFFQEKYEWAKKTGVFAVDTFRTVWDRLVDGVIYEELIKQESQIPWDHIITSDGTKSPMDIRFSEATCSVQEMIKQLVHQAVLSKDPHKASEELAIILKVFPDFDTRKHNYHKSLLSIRQAARKQFLAVPSPIQQLFNSLSSHAEEEKEALQKVYLHEFERYGDYFQGPKESYIDFIKYNTHLKEQVASYHFRRLMQGSLKSLKEEDALFLEAILDLLLLPEHRLVQVSGNIAHDPGSSGFASQDHTKTGPNIIHYEEGTHSPPHNEIWDQLFTSSQKLPPAIRYMIVSHHLPLLLLQWAKDLKELGLDIKFHLWFSKMLPKKLGQLQKLVLNHPNLTFKKIMLHLWPEYYYAYEKQSQNGKEKLKKLPPLESGDNLGWIPKGQQKNLFTLIHEWGDRWLAYHSASSVSLKTFTTEIFDHINPKDYFKISEEETSPGNKILFYMLSLASQLPINVHEITHSQWKNSQISQYFSTIFWSPKVKYTYASQLAIALRLGCTAESVQINRKQGLFKISNLKRKDYEDLCEVLVCFSNTDFIKTLDLSSNQIFFPNGGYLYFLAEDKEADVNHLPAIKKLQDGTYQLFKRTDVYSQTRGYVIKPLTPQYLNTNSTALNTLWQQGQVGQKILLSYDNPLMQQLTTSPYQQFINILKKLRNLETLILSDNPIGEPDLLIYLLQPHRNPDSPLQTLILEGTYTHQFPSSYIELIRHQVSKKQLAQFQTSKKKESSKDCTVIINNKAPIKPDHFDLTYKERKEIFGVLQRLLANHWKDRNKKTNLNEEGCIAFANVSYLDMIASVVEQLGDNFWNESLAASPESWARILATDSGGSLQELFDVLNVCNQARITHGKPLIKESAFKLAFAIKFGLPQGTVHGTPTSIEQIKQGLVFHPNNGNASSKNLSQPSPHKNSSLILTTKSPNSEPLKRRLSRNDGEKGQSLSLKTSPELLSFSSSKLISEEDHPHNLITKEASCLKYLTISDVPIPQELPRTLRLFSQLTRLHLTSLGLITLDILPSSPFLQFLDLSDNQLPSLEGLSTKYPRLCSLKVPRNKIKDLSLLLNMEKLTYLDISRNKIEDFMGLFTLQPLAFNFLKVKYLDLSHNQIVMNAVRWNITQICLPSCLEHLDLSYNQLGFPPTMRRYPSNFFNISYNNIDMGELHKIFSLQLQLGDLITFRNNGCPNFYNDPSFVVNPTKLIISKDKDKDHFYCTITGKKPLNLTKAPSQLQSILWELEQGNALVDKSTELSRAKELLIEFIIKFDPYYLDTPFSFLLINQKYIRSNT